MRSNGLWLAALIGVGTLLPVTGNARTDVSVGINVGPPPAPVVVAPPPPVAQPGYVWAPGYWGWEGYRYVWVEGRWMAPRPGYGWVAPRWERRGPNWFFVEGYWAPHHHNGRRW